MKTIVSLFVCAGWVVPVMGATHAVLPGGSIQEKIDLAEPGDIVAIFGGTYSDDVTVNKAVRLVEVDGEDVTLTGNVLFTGVTNPPPFEGFTVGSSGKGITVTDSTGLVIKDVDSSSGASLTVNGAADVGVIGGVYSAATHDGGVMSVNSTRINGGLTSTVNASKIVLLRVSIADTIRSDADQTWMGYSSAKYGRFYGASAEHVIVGSTFDSGGNYSQVVIMGGSANRFTMVNTIAKGGLYGTHWVNSRTTHYGTSVVQLDAGNSAFIANCYFKSLDNSTHSHPFDHNPHGNGLYSFTADCTAVNNIVETARRGIQMPFGSDANNNFFYSCYFDVVGGVVDRGSLSGNPLYDGDAPKLQLASPCVDAGIDDPIFDDLPKLDVHGDPFFRDRYGPRGEARNNIGPSGGCWYDPAGWTTDRPVVISFDLGPQQLLKGVDTEVVLSGGQAVAQP